jgi:hypothetical protein
MSHKQKSIIYFTITGFIFILILIFSPDSNQGIWSNPNQSKVSLQDIIIFVDHILFLITSAKGFLELKEIESKK